MAKTDTPISNGDEKVGKWEDNDVCLVSSLGIMFLQLFIACSESDIAEENSIGQDSSHKEEILDEDPGSEGRDPNTHRRTGGDGGYQEGGEGQEQSHQETHPARNHLRSNNSEDRGNTSIPEG